MFRITNLTDKPIDITKTIILRPNSTLDVTTSISNRLYQLMNMKLIKIQELATDRVSQVTNSNVSAFDIRRKQTLEKIKRGEVQSSISLDVPKNINVVTSENIKNSNKKVKRKNK